MAADETPRSADSASSPLLFEDGLGQRLSAQDSFGEPIEQLRLCPDLAALEPAIRERIGRLINFRHARYVRLRGSERLPGPDKHVVIASDSVSGARVAQLLELSENGGNGTLRIDIDSALAVVRELLPAIAVLHDSRNVTHGAIGPERLVLTPQGRLIIVDHGLGLALGKTGYSRRKFWQQLRVAVPPGNGKVVFDARTDVVQIGLVALALILGRLIGRDEFPQDLGKLIDAARETSARGGQTRPLSPDLRAWLERSLPTEHKASFNTVREAQQAFEALFTGKRTSAGAAALKTLMSRYDAIARGESVEPASPARTSTSGPVPADVRAAEQALAELRARTKAITSSAAKREAEGRERAGNTNAGDAKADDAKSGDGLGNAVGNANPGGNTNARNAGADSAGRIAGARDANVDNANAGSVKPHGAAPANANANVNANATANTNAEGKTDAGGDADAAWSADFVVTAGGKPDTSSGGKAAATVGGKTGAKPEASATSGSRVSRTPRSVVSLAPPNAKPSKTQADLTLIAEADDLPLAEPIFEADTPLAAPPDSAPPLTSEVPVARTPSASGRSASTPPTSPTPAGSAPNSSASSAAPSSVSATLRTPASRPPASPEAESASAALALAAGAPAASELSAFEQTAADTYQDAASSLNASRTQAPEPPTRPSSIRKVPFIDAQAILQMTAVDDATPLDTPASFDLPLDLPAAPLADAALADTPLASAKPVIEIKPAADIKPPLASRPSPVATSGTTNRTTNGTTNGNGKGNANGNADGKQTSDPKPVAIDLNPRDAKTSEPTIEIAPAIAAKKPTPEVKPSDAKPTSNAAPPRTESSATATPVPAGPQTIKQSPAAASGGGSPAIDAKPAPGAATPHAESIAATTLASIDSQAIKSPSAANGDQQGSAGKQASAAPRAAELKAPADVPQKAAPPASTPRSVDALPGNADATATAPAGASSVTAPAASGVAAASGSSPASESTAPAAMPVATAPIARPKAAPPARTPNSLAPSSAGLQTTSTAPSTASSTAVPTMPGIATSASVPHGPESVAPAAAPAAIAPVAPTITPPADTTRAVAGPSGADAAPSEPWSAVSPALDEVASMAAPDAPLPKAASPAGVPPSVAMPPAGADATPVAPSAAAPSSFGSIASAAPPKTVPPVDVSSSVVTPASQAETTQSEPPRASVAAVPRALGVASSLDALEAHESVAAAAALGAPAAIALAPLPNVEPSAGASPTVAAAAADAALVAALSAPSIAVPAALSNEGSTAPSVAPSSAAASASDSVAPAATPVAPATASPSPRAATLVGVPPSTAAPAAQVEAASAASVASIAAEAAVSATATAPVASTSLASPSDTDTTSTSASVESSPAAASTFDVAQQSVPPPQGAPALSAVSQMPQDAAAVVVPLASQARSFVATPVSASPKATTSADAKSATAIRGIDWNADHAVSEDVAMPAWARGVMPASAGEVAQPVEPLRSEPIAAPATEDLVLASIADIPIASPSRRAAWLRFRKPVSSSRSDVAGADGQSNESASGAGSTASSLARSISHDTDAGADADADALNDGSSTDAVAAKHPRSEPAALIRPGSGFLGAALNETTDVPAPRPVRRMPRMRININWKRTIAASIVVSLLEGVAFATAYWFATPVEPGTLLVETTPIGIEVLVDGHVSGKTPYSGALQPGRHTIELRVGASSRVIPVEISPGVQTMQRVLWSKGLRTGQARITSTPAGARVNIDGLAHGITPLTVSTLAAGRHNVVITSDSGTVSAPLSISPGETTEMDVPVFPGWVSVLAPVELLIYDGERLIGTTEGEKLLIAPGKHTLAFVSETLGWKGTQNVLVTPGATAAVSIVLPKAPVAVVGPAGAQLFIDNEPAGTLPIDSVRASLGTRDFVIRHPQLGERRQAVTVTQKAPARVVFD